jgi:hypothetical protein
MLADSKTKAQRKPSAARPPVQRKAEARSAISNGAKLLDGVDQRSKAARRFFDIIASLEADLGGALSEVERQQVRVCAGAILHAESLTAATVRGEVVDPEQQTRAANAASRALGALKRRGRPKPAGPSLAEYLADLAAEEAAA